MVKKIEYIDILKGYLIVLVVLGHCIQWGMGDKYTLSGLFWDDVIFKGIYMFHMPLFICISGYLFYFSLKKYDLHTLLKKKVIRLFIPLILFAVIHLLIQIISGEFGSSFGPLKCIKALIRNVCFDLWFIWATIVAMIVVIIGYNIKNKILRVIYCGCLGGIILLLPDFLTSGLYEYMLPYFVIGFYIGKSNSLQKLSQVKLKFILVLGVLFIVCFSCWNVSTYIYNSSMYVYSLKSLYAWIIRFLSGVIGCALFSIVVFYTSKYIPDFIKRSIMFAGNNSLWIYILNTYTVKLISRVTSNFSYSLGALLLEAFICIILYYIILSFLGGKK